MFHAFHSFSSYKHTFTTYPSDLFPWSLYYRTITPSSIFNNRYLLLPKNVHTYVGTQPLASLPTPPIITSSSSSSHHILRSRNLPSRSSPQCPSPYLGFRTSPNSTWLGCIWKKLILTLTQELSSRSVSFNHCSASHYHSSTIHIETLRFLNCPSCPLPLS